MMNSQGIRGPPYRFIHGNNKQITRMKMEASTKPMVLTHDIFPRLQPHIYTWLNTYGKNYLYWNGAEAELVISEPELVKEVLINSGKAFLKRKPTDLGNKLLGTGLVTVEGEKWVKQRKLANHVFHGESLKNMNQAMIASVETMVARWKGQEGKEMEMYQEFKLLTSEVISRTAFGSSYLEGEKIFNMLNKLSMIVIRNVFKLTLVCLCSKLWKSADLKEAEELEKGIQDCVMEIVKKREDKVVNGEAESFGDDFLGLLIKAYHDSDEGKRLLLQDLVDECKTFYLAGQETVNSLLGWAVLLLSIHRDWQEKARREVIEIFGNQNPHHEGIHKLKTMSMIINETLRLYGPLNGLPREAAREVQLGNLLLPANMKVSVLNVLHHDPQLWGADVHLFKPERFADGVAKATNYNAAAFFPFGLGPRSCAGMAFATTEAKIALSMILQRYSMILSPGYVHKPVLTITIRPQHGIQVILESLHNDA
ncbi:CYP749A22 protein [Hibiscus syriacus]|uniref:CYP749A22 protein n=2 Tax=Hibiscus syriacus TaxID=106335 RepID=A0A6A2XKR6_HIBSY|nr:CYP749A22 protein [Hibiscus syriacus]